MTVKIVGPLQTAPATGGAGLAGANIDSTHPIQGMLHSMYVEYLDSPPATTDVIIKTKGTHAPVITLLTLTNKNTSGWFKPRYAVHDNLGVAIANEYDREAVNDYVNISIAQADNNDYIKVWLKLEV